MGIDTQRNRITLNPPIDCMVVEKGGSLVAPFSATDAIKSMVVSPNCFSAEDLPNGYYVTNDSASANKAYFWLGLKTLDEATAAPQACGLVVVSPGCSIAVSAFGRLPGLDLKRTNLQCAAAETASVFVHTVNY